MAEVMENTGTVCGVLLAAGLIGRLCPKNKALGFIQALTALVLLASLAGTLFHADWHWPEPGEEEEWQNGELNEYVSGQYQQAAQREAETYLRGLLAAAGMEVKKITADINITEDGRIELTRVAAMFQFESDARRADALLRSALGEAIYIEVTADGA